MRFSCLRFFILLFSSFKAASAQNFLLPNEHLIFSFNTITEKKVVLAKDSTDKYIVYRFGTEEEIEINFPQLIKDSWERFTYSYYFRGSGVDNEGLDLNYVNFIEGNYKYIIYQVFSASDDKKNCGLKIINVRTNELTELIGKPESTEGNLIQLRNNELIRVSNELFD